MVTEDSRADADDFEVIGPENPDDTRGEDESQDSEDETIDRGDGQAMAKGRPHSVVAPCPIIESADRLEALPAP